MNKKQYNEIPVFYCKDCLSLAILRLDDYNYCKHCGSTDIDVAMIEDWEKIYKEKHGRKFLSR